MKDLHRRVRVVCARCSHDGERTQKAGALKSLEELRRICRCGKCGARASHGLLTIDPIIWPPTIVVDRKPRSRRAKAPANHPTASTSLQPRAPKHRKRRRRKQRWGALGLSWKDEAHSFLEDMRDLFAAIGGLIPLIRFVVIAGIAAAATVALGWGAAQVAGASFTALADAGRIDRSLARYPYLRTPPGDAREAARTEFCERRLYWIETGGAGYTKDRALDQLIGACPDYLGQIAKLRAGETIYYTSAYN